MEKRTNKHSRDPFGARDALRFIHTGNPGTLGYPAARTVPHTPPHGLRERDIFIARRSLLGMADRGGGPRVRPRTYRRGDNIPTVSRFGRHLGRAPTVESAFCALVILLGGWQMMAAGPQASSALSFDVARVKSSGPDTGYKFVILPGSHLIWSHTNVELMIKWAYELRDGQLFDAPNWVHSKGFDVDAKCDPPVGSDYSQMTREQRRILDQQVRERLQSLLSDRFQLKLGQETREMPVYELVLDKNGPKYRPSKPGPEGTVKQGIIARPGHIEAYQMSMETVARALSQFAGRIVLDRTALSGTYDLALNWNPDNEPVPGDLGNNAPGSRTSADVAGPALVTAVRDQLGLKLKPSKAAVPVYVVEKISLPLPN